MRKKNNAILEQVKIEDYAAEGKSIARVNGKVVFVERAVPGDVIDIQLTKSKKDWAEGHPVRFHSLSDARVIPFCQHFGVCGGCQWQMLPYEKQLQFKHQQVIDALNRIGKIRLPDIAPIIGCDATRYYRNKLEYTFGSKQYFPQKPKDEELLNDQGAAGFHARGFFDKVVQIETCYLQPEPTNSIRNTLYSFAREQKIPFYDQRSHSGFLRNVQVRTTSTNQTMVNIVFGYDDPVLREAVIGHLLEKVQNITTLLYTINTKWNDSLNELIPVVYTGAGYIVEQLGDFRFKIGPTSFFQTNSLQAKRLYDVAVEFAELNGNEILYDLYCGTGSIGIYASKNARKIIGVDVVEAAIRDAIENAKLNNIEHAAFVAGDVIEVCNDVFFETHGKPGVVITDPPRAGMHEKLVRKIIDINAPIVVYVSCNPATQARDLHLLDATYEVTKVQPVDMFPHTHHIENVVQLKLRSV